MEEVVEIDTNGVFVVLAEPILMQRLSGSGEAVPSLSPSHSVSSFHALVVLIGRAESPQLTA